MYTCMCLNVTQYKLTALLWWLSVSHHPAGQAASGMACGLAVRVPPLAQVIFILMHLQRVGVKGQRGNYAVSVQDTATYRHCTCYNSCDSSNTITHNSSVAIPLSEVHSEQVWEMVNEVL